MKALLVFILFVFLYVGISIFMLSIEAHAMTFAFVFYCLGALCVTANRIALDEVREC